MTEIETAKMSERGQIIIPKDVRDYIRASENTLFAVMPLDRQTIVMKKLDKEKLVEEFRHIRDNVKSKLSEEEVLEEIANYRKEKRG